MVIAATFQNVALVRRQFPFTATAADCFLAMDLLKVVLEAALLAVRGLAVMAVVWLFVGVTSVMNSKAVWV